MPTVFDFCRFINKFIRIDMKNILEIPRTAMEVFSMLPEGTLCEVIDNAIYMSPAPTPNHQEVLAEIFF